MINGLEGVPGSGKSYEAVVYHVLVALQSGRLVITNLPLNVEMFAAIDPSYRYLIELRTRAAPIRGTWDADRVDDKGNGNAFDLFEDRHTEKPDSSVTTFGHVWCYYSNWKHPETGVGPLFVIDECHNPLPTVGTQAAVVEWFKLHRHYNVDVLLMTQSFRDMCQPIARLMGVLVKVRKADILGKADHYIRKVHGGYRGAVISTEQRKYRPEMFPLYKSHTQGNGVAELAAGDVSPFVVKFRRFTWLFWVFAVPFAVWAFWPKAKAEPKMPAEVQKRIERAERAARDVPPIATAQASEKPATGLQAGAAEVPEPYASKGLHLAGMMAMGKRVLYTFVVSDGGRRISEVSSDDLVRAGYVWEPLTDCAGTLRWKSNAKAITCDAPMVPQGSKSDPVVLAMPKGAAPLMPSSPGAM